MYSLPVFEGLMRTRYGGKVYIGVTVEERLFELIERTRTTKKGRIPRNAFIRQAIINFIQEGKEYNGT